jgi:hypothetical protein
MRWGALAILSAVATDAKTQYRSGDPSKAASFVCR